MLPLFLSTALLGVAVPGSTPTTTIPTVRIEQTIVPDWSVLSFAKLPAIAQSGSLQGQSWSAGQRVEQLLTLGDFQDSFKLQDLNLYAISLAAQTPPETIKLDQFKLLQRQTLSNLANAVPELEKVPVSQVKPLSDLLRSAKSSDRLLEATLPQLLAQDPTLGALSFQSVDLSLYSLEDIPGLAQAPLQAFHHWQEAELVDIPGLREMPWQKFPNPPGESRLSGIVQLPTSPVTNSNSISGSSTIGYQVPCVGCTGIGFSNPPWLQEKRWISGLAQWVQGGTGDVATSANNREPTGRNVFGKAFKVVVTEVSQKEAKTTLYFRFCQSDRQQQIRCSPYALGPVPFLGYRTGESMPIGTLGEESARSPSQTEQIPPPTPAEVPNSPNSQWLQLLTQMLGQLRAVFQSTFSLLA